MFKRFFIFGLVSLCLIGCHINDGQPSELNPNNLPSAPDRKGDGQLPAVTPMHLLFGSADFGDKKVVELKLKANSMTMKPINQYSKGWYSFTADLYEDTAIHTDELDLVITGQIQGTYVSDEAEDKSVSGYYLAIAHLTPQQQLKSEPDGSKVVVNDGVINGAEVTGAADDSSTIRNSPFADEIALKGPVAFQYFKRKLFFKSFTPKDDQIYSIGRLFFKVAGGQSLKIEDKCPVGKLELALVSAQEQADNPRLIPATPDSYDFKECVPANAVRLSRPFSIESNISIIQVNHFDSSGFKNEGVLSSDIKEVSVAGFAFKVSSPEIKFSSISNYASEFKIMEFQIARQSLNFHYNWTDTTPGSTTPKPIVVPIIADALVSLYGSQPSVSMVVEYNSKMRWEGHWTNGTNLYVGVPWNTLPNASEASAYRFCLVAIDYGSGLGGDRDPNISGFGVSPYTSMDATKYCGNDYDTMNKIYKKAIADREK